MITNHFIVLGVHKVQRVTTTTGIVPFDQVVLGVPDHNIPGVADIVIHNLVIEAVP